MTTSDPGSERMDGRSVTGGGPMPARPVVTVAALYGAGGSVIGPRVAERLGVQFLDRAIPASVAEQTGVREEIVAGYDEQPRSAMSRLIRNLARVAPPGDAEPMSRMELEERGMRIEIERFLGHASLSGGVVLGRGGNVVLRSVPGVLSVLLIGPRDARVRQAMEIEDIDRQMAERRLDANDEARVEYVRRNYGISGLDANDYHLVLDSSAFDLDTCVDLIVAASGARRRRAAAGV